MSTRASATRRPGSATDLQSTDRPRGTLHFGPDVPPVRSSPTALVRRLSQMCMGMMVEGLANSDLTALQYAVLSNLNPQDGEPGIDQNGLAARIGVERSHVSVLVEELVTKGLVEQRVNGADRRARLLHLTPKGEKLYARLRPDVRIANERVLEPLSTHERRLFIDMLIRMIAANGAHARPGTRRRKRGLPPSRSNDPRAIEKSTDLDGRTS
jgi:DNA-binding MarR family transcriptional regulator